ncbi:MAG: SulP family sulfate permease [Salibacteraceae bacterium]
MDFIESKVGDHSGVEALRTITNKYLDAGKNVTLTHLSPDCKAMLIKWSPEFETIIQDAIDDPRYYVVTDMMDAEV